MAKSKKAEGIKFDPSEIPAATAAPVDPEDASDVTIPLGTYEAAEDGPDSPPAEDSIMSRMTAALEALAAKESKTSATDPAVLLIMQTLAQAVDRLTEGQLKGSQLIAAATKKANRPSNEAIPNISVFNLRGEKDFPKPKLKCRMLLPWEADEDASTREEIELLNLLEPGEYIIKRNDRTKIKMRVRCEYGLDSDKPSVLVMNHETAFNNDNFRTAAPLVDMLREMLKQNPKTRQKEKEVLTEEEEIALILAGRLNDGTVPENGRVISVGE